ncbi:DUF3304 domain-containing protein [Chromobacterium violaceum]|uniref:DUF3304 domain-containing protein n=1 Tax=Chromobacterium violaceum TaxID=536 RepID=UPI001B339E3D|nr:DUF3304 domain-containing protein [Chromobacterium violaceum]MBP4045179.1 DUF3304 domain-containing protein [Chromobacterium violaceum]
MSTLQKTSKKVNKIESGFKRSFLMKTLKPALPCFLLAMFLAGCQPAENQTEEAKPKDRVTVSTDAVNYMHDWGLIYTLTDLRSGQAVGGSTLGFLEGPGGKGCCVSLPAKWQPGMQLKLEWQKSDKNMTEQTKRVKTLEIPRYEQPGDLYVLFYPEDKVELIASNVEPGSPAWPGKIKTDPYSACLTRLPEKECKKNLPKYAPGSAEEGAALVRRSCQPEIIKQSTTPDKDRELCTKWVKECIAKGIIDKKMCQLDYQEN